METISKLLNYKIVKTPCFYKQKGFTLVELLVVIAIAAVLGGFMTVNFVDARKKARDAQRKSNLRQLQSVLELFRADAGCYPDSTCATTISWATCNAPVTAGATTYMQKKSCDPSGLSYYNGGQYYFTSNGRTYTLAACLENANDLDGTTTNPGGSGTCATGKWYVLQNP